MVSFSRVKQWSAFVLVPLLSLTLAHSLPGKPTPTPSPQPGLIDPSFHPSNGANNTVNAVIGQNDGKVIVAGRFLSINGVARGHLARLNADGSLDSTFNSGTGADGDVNAAILQPDGRVVIAGIFTSVNGFARKGIARLNSDGSVDPNFGFSVGIDNTPLSLALQNDGRILVGGKFSSVDNTLRFNLARLNTDGQVDLTFDPGNGPNGDVNAIAIQSDGRIVIGGNFIGYNGFSRGGVARVLSNGSLDPTFDSTTGTGGNVFALALEPDGRVVIGGRFVQYAGINRTFIARTNFDGSLDGTFNPQPNNWVQSLFISSDGRIVVGGFFTGVNGIARGRIARLNFSDGSLDFSFNPGTGFAGSLTNDATQVRALAGQRFNRIIAGGVFTVYQGSTRLNVARLFGSARVQLANISTRGNVMAGDGVLIGGFIVQGSTNETVVLRGLGPSLSSSGIANPLADPVLTLHAANGSVLLTNDNWKDTQQAQIQATGLAPTNDLESTILTTLAPGAYSVVLEGKNLTTVTGLVEIFDTDNNADSQPINLSTRGFVGTNNDVLIGGTIISGDANTFVHLAVRALGPSLANGGISAPLADPVLSLRDANGNQIAANDNWRDSQAAAIIETGLAPSNDKESVLLAFLAPGAYSAVVSGKGNGTGIGLVEFFNLP